MFLSKVETRNTMQWCVPDCSKLGRVTVNVARCFGLESRSWGLQGWINRHTLSWMTCVRTYARTYLAYLVSNVLSMA